MTYQARLILEKGLLISLLLLLSSCQSISSLAPDAPPTSVPPTTMAVQTATTQAAVSLPYVVKPGPGASPTVTPLSAGVPSVTPRMLSTDTPVGQPPKDVTLLFTGVIVPARCVQASIERRGDANFVYDEVRDLVSSADLAVGTLNASLSDLSRQTGCVQTYVLVGDSRSASAAAAAGFDVMSVATNHIKNCAGASCEDYYNWAFKDTLKNLRENGILPVGAGMDAAEALQPVVIEVQGIRFGFVSLGMVEPLAFAGEYSPGIAELNDENLEAAIQAARLVSDVVIAMPHWGPEDTSEPNSYQLHYAQVAVEAGADVVVGNHTHVVQAIQNINGIDVFYGLGNFIFDQTWDLAHQQGVILLLHFTGAEYSGYELIPTHVDGDGTVHIAGPDEAGEILRRIEQASAALR